VAGASASSPCPERPAPFFPSSSQAKKFLFLLLSAFQLLNIPAFALNATWNAATDIPVTAASYTAVGNTIAFSLNCVPTASEMMLLKNTRPAFIQGTFSNLSQGQMVNLSYAGQYYHFVANYYGGSGNDLVLVWAGSRVVGWGSNSNSQLADGTTDQRLLPVGLEPTLGAGVLLAKTVLSVAAGQQHSLALCSDGTVAAWGYNGSGQLGDGTTTDRGAPVAVNCGVGSALHDKTVVAVAAGQSHSMALCSDGTVAVWGSAFGTASSSVPVAVSAAAGSALFGKTVVAVAAGSQHSLALCSDGTVAAWGVNNQGQLGDGTTMPVRTTPVSVSTGTGSALNGKTVTAIAAGLNYSLALCSDGTVVAWGVNIQGQLGAETANPPWSFVPVAVNAVGGSALSSKKVVAIAAGSQHSLALCSDGTVAAWGSNSSGQLGDGTTTQQSVPIAANVEVGSALFEKTVMALRAGSTHSLVLCSDGSLVAWGENGTGQLGDGTITDRKLPVVVSGGALDVSERFTGVSGGESHSLALVGYPGNPALHVAELANLATSEGVLSPTFHSSTTSYTCAVASGAASITLIPVVDDYSTVRVNGVAVTSGHPSAPIPINVGANAISILVTSLDGTVTKTYTLTANRPPDTHTLIATWNAPSDVPVTASAYVADGSTVDFALHCVPLTNELVVVRNTGPAFIQGRFDNLAQGQVVPLSYAGQVYRFVANYYGGRGRDLVLVWEGNRIFAWGSNTNGQLGDGTTTDYTVPTTGNAALGAGVLLGRTVVAVAAGGFHSLALCSDGTVAAWGDNASGQLGDGTITQQTVPVEVNHAPGSALEGKTVVAVAAGQSHSLALCSDGTVAAWGSNSRFGFGQLGDGTSTDRSIPVAVNTVVGSALYGKSVVAVAAGYGHSLALCSDGTVAAWGANMQGQLGAETAGPPWCLVPVAVDTTSSSTLSGKTVVAVAAGQFHSLVLCSDGTVAAWGQGPLGNGSSASQYNIPPVAVSAAPGSALHAKTVLAVTAGSFHSMALCSDGTLAAWGDNSAGELGDGTTTDRIVPVAVNAASGSPLYGKTVTAVAGGSSYSIALCSDGTLAAWGTNDSGQLGDGTWTQSNLPVAVNRGGLVEEERFTGLLLGTAGGGSHSLALVGSAVKAPVPVCATGITSELTSTSVRLSGSANALGFNTKLAFEYGSDGMTFPNKANGDPGVIYGSADMPVTALITGLPKGTKYYYRLTAQSQGGLVFGSIESFITRTEPTVGSSAATALNTISAQISGLMNAHGSETQTYIDYGTDPVNLPYSVPATPAVVSGYSDTSVNVMLNNLFQGTTYYYRIRATSIAGVGTSLTGSFQLASLCGLNRIAPPSVPDAQGYVFVTLGPSGIASGWRFVGEQQWRSSGIPAGVLTTGSRDIEFRPVPGYIQPPQETVGVISGEAATVLDRTYYTTVDSGSGGLSVTLKPDSISAGTLAVTERAQWRLLGEDDTQWRDSGTMLSPLLPGNYLLECKPVSGRATPNPVAVSVVAGQTVATTATYQLASAANGVQPSVLSFDDVTGNTAMPHAYVGQIRSDSGSSSGFVVKSRVVATAAHVLFDDGTLSSVTGLQWLFERDRGTYEPVPQTPRGFYLFDGYAAQRVADNSPGVSTPASQNLDAAALYFLEPAGRGGYGGYLASDLDNNEFLISSKWKMLVGYPVDSITTLRQGRMHATPPGNVNFAKAYGHTYTTSDIRASGGASGGPLCVLHDNGNWYPAAIYLGGSNQTVVRAIDSQVIELFNRAEVSGNGGTNNTGGGISHTSVTGTLNTTQPGSLRVIVEPAAAVTAGAGWRLKPESSYRASGAQKSGLSSGSYVLELPALSGFQAPTQPSVAVSGGQLTTYTYTYAPLLTALETWRLTNFGITTNTGTAADTADPDHDGQNNLAEFAAGTNPNNPADVLKVLTTQRSGSGFVLTATGKAGRTYALQRSTNLATGTWATVATLAPLAADGPVTLTDHAAPADKAFYRIQVFAP